jgi:hypothetical protein
MFVSIKELERKISCRTIPDWLIITTISAGLVIAVFMLQGNIGLNLADEGKLWYGAIRTARGKVPLLDHRSYDPGRYYWIAGWSWLFGDGILALRKSVAIFQWLGLTCGLLTLRRLIRSWWFLIVAGGLLLIWMYPRHKLFEPVLAMMAVYLLTRLIENPSLGMHVSSGVYVGIASFFGINLGLYVTAASLCIIVFVWYKQKCTRLLPCLLCYGGGMFLGYLPMIGLGLFVQDFAKFFIYHVSLRSKYVNLPLPIPYPWKIDMTYLISVDGVRAFSLGLFFLIIPIFYVVLWIYVIPSNPSDLKRRAPLIASICVGLPYFHHALARADIGHLAQAIHPFLLGMLCVPYLLHHPVKKILWGLVGIVAIMSSVTIVKESPFYQKQVALKTAFVPFDIRGDHLWIEAGTAQFIQNITGTLLEYNIAADDPIFIVSFLPGIYPILQKDSPTWEIYFSFPASKPMQEYMISQLIEKQVKWAFVSDASIDNRDELRFTNTHPLLWEYLLKYFEPVPTEKLPKGFRLFKYNESVTTHPHVISSDSEKSP